MNNKKGKLEWLAVPDLEQKLAWQLFVQEKGMRHPERQVDRL
jgi:hypothetical protein